MFLIESKGRYAIQRTSRVTDVLGQNSTSLQFVWRRLTVYEAVRLTARPLILGLSTASAYQHGTE
jgi:hypothetical protein